MSDYEQTSDIAFWEEKLPERERWLRAMSWIEGTWMDHVHRTTLLDSWHRTYYGNTSIFYGDQTSESLEPSLHAAKTTVDTLVNLIISDDTRARFVPVEGEWSDRLKCKNAERFVDGIFQAEKFYQELRPRIASDIAIYGTGHLQVVQRKDTIGYERVYTGDILVDEQVSIISEPVILGRVRNVSAHALARQYPKFKNEIMRSVQQRPTFMSSYQADHTAATRVDYMTQCYDIWFCTGLPGDRGWFVRVIHFGGDGGVLESEPYELERVPIVTGRNNPARNGFFGQSVAAVCKFEQEESDALIRKISNNATLSGDMKILAESGSIDPKQLTNKACSIVFHSPGTSKPQFVTPPSVASDIYSHLQFVLRYPLEKMGLSQLTAYGKKPPDVEAAVAMQELQDIESVRQSAPIKFDQNFVVEVAERTVDMAARMYEKDGISVKSKYQKRSFVKTVDWKNINLSRDRFVISVMPSSLLPRTPGAKLGRVGFMMDKGLIDQDDALSMLDIPDVDQRYALSSAMKDAIDDASERMLYEGEAILADRYLATEFGIQRMASILQRAGVDGAPETRLELVRRWIDSAMAIKMQMDMVASAQAAPPEGAPPPPMPPAGPGVPQEAMIPGDVAPVSEPQAAA